MERFLSQFQPGIGIFFLTFSLCFNPKNTLQEVRMEGLVSSEHSSHLIVVWGVDVLVNAVSSELHLEKKRGIQAAGPFSALKHPTLQF